MPELDRANYKGREQAFVKHYLLSRYVRDMGYKTGSFASGLVYIDGFAGPWGSTTKDLSDTSFGIAIDSLKQVQSAYESRGKPIKISCELVEKRPSAFQTLSGFAENRSMPNFSVKSYNGDFLENIKKIQHSIKSFHGSTEPFKFTFLDPKGWSGLCLNTISPLITGRPNEVLVNIMTSFIRRFLREPDRQISFDKLFGRQGVTEKIEQAPQKFKQDAIVLEYCLSLKKKFNFVSSTIIFHENRESIRYFLVYATNHPTGIKVFKEAESQACVLQEEMRSQKVHTKEGYYGGLLDNIHFDGNPSHSVITSERIRFYQLLMKRSVLSLLVKNASRPVDHKKLFCRAMEYPLVSKQDFDIFLAEISRYIKIILDAPNGQKRRTLSWEYTDKILALNVEALNAISQNIVNEFNVIIK